MKKLLGILLFLIILFSCASFAYGEVILPQASEEILDASISLSSGKKIVYDVTLSSQSYTVRVNYCYLYKETASGGWEYVCSMPNGIPASAKGDMTTSCDISDYITSSGKFQARVSITVGSSTVYRSASRTY